MTPRSRSGEAFVEGPRSREEAAFLAFQRRNDSSMIHQMGNFLQHKPSKTTVECREGRSAGNQRRDLRGRKASFRRPAQGRRAVSSTTYALERTGRDARTVRHWMSAVNGQERNSPTQTDRSSIEPRKRRGTRHKRQPETAYSRISWCDGSGGCQVQDREPADPSNYGKNRTAPIRK